MKLNYFYTMHERKNSSTKMQDEGSEEGEIVDSDEEQNMRQRIKELEAKNDELEKIASISGDYTNQYKYSTDHPPFRSRLQYLQAKHTSMSQKDVARIPSDASSISSDEMEPIKKRIKRKGRHTKKDQCKKCRSRSNSLHKHIHRTHRSENKLTKSEDCCKKHNRLRSQKSNSPVIINENYLETISLDSDEDSGHHKSNSISDYEGKGMSLHLNRAELRFALARTKETKISGNLLRERLYNGNALLEQKENVNTCHVITDSLDAIKSENKSHVSEQSVESSDKDECATQEEQELRLIALKSAILKKHLARKKRNAEMAYSPTDFAPIAANPIITDDNMDVVEEELDELNDVMEISPINSPRLVLSPDTECELSQSAFRTTGDNNSIDMDIAQSGSEEEFDNNKNDGQWYPIDTEPVTQQPNGVNNEVLNYPLPLHYGIYVPEMQYQLPPPPNAMIKHSEVIENDELPPPPGTNIYTDFIIDEDPPPPPSMYITIKDDEELPLPANTLNTFENVFPTMNYDEEPPPPPSFFPEYERSSLENSVFQRLSTKTEDSSEDLQFVITDVRSCTPEMNRVQDEIDLSEDDENKDSDEEVSALRAVLLSKLQTSKKQNKEHVVKKVSEQYLPNLEIVCHTEEKPDKNGVETVLQKALRRLKSNFTSSSTSSKENDARAVRIKEDCLNTATIMVEVVTTNSDTEELETLSTKSLPQLDKKSTSTRNRIIKKIKTMGSSRDKSNKVISSKPDTSAVLSETPAKDNVNCPQPISELVNEPHESHSEVVSEPLILDRLPVEISKGNDEVARDDNEIKNSEKVCVTKNNSAGAKESTKDAVKEKQKITGDPTPKNTVSNENSKNKEIILKKKRLDLGASLAVPARVQPLSVKNNLIPSGISSLKSAQNFLQSTLNKVRTTRTTKIVRPNKVINKEITTNIKRAMTPTGSPTPPTKIQRTILNTSAKSTNSALPSTDAPPKITVKKLVINLRASETETSDDELMREVHVPVDNSIERVKSFYNEISSPLELVMNSASCSPARNRNSLPNEAAVTVNNETPATNSATNTAFEQKLDAFLKDIRKKGNVEKTIIESPKCSVLKKNDGAKNFNTPTAVRHLPLASQDEYRRLVHRMKLLEKQKQTKKSDEEVASEIPISKNIPVPNGTLQSDDDKHAKENATSVTKRNIQLKTLLSYEKSFEQTSDNIVKLLNKSLGLVAEAKRVKITKLRHEQRLQKLREEMARIQALYEQEERKFSTMKPHIGASNQFLTSLKKKRRNLMDSANKLGKTLQGDKYRLNNKSSEEIIAKSRKLHAEIKLVNSLKTENIETALTHPENTKDTGASLSNDATTSSMPKSKGDNSEVAEKQCSQIPAPMIVVNQDLSEAQKENSAQPTVEEAQSSVGQTPAEQNKNSNQHCEDQNMTMTEVTVEENTQNECPEPTEILENEKRVELEIQHEDNTAEEAKDLSPDNAMPKSIVPVYTSPLDHFRHEYRNIDSKAIICPYEMWGKCADECCSYMHMTMGKRRGTELAFKPKNAENL